MVQVQQRILRKAALLLAAALLPAAAQKFYPDDPMSRDPAPLPVKAARNRTINEYFDYFQNTFAEPGKSRASKLPMLPGGAAANITSLPIWSGRIRNSLIPTSG